MAKRLHRNCADKTGHTQTTTHSLTIALLIVLIDRTPHPAEYSNGQFCGVRHTINTPYLGMNQLVSGTILASLIPEQCTNLRIWRRFFSEDVKKNHLETLEMLF
jgi:hypothetical protein